MYLITKKKWRMHWMNKDEIVEHMINFVENKEKELQDKERLTQREKTQFARKIISELERVMDYEN